MVSVSYEQDRYVVIGNRLDAWNSGGAVGTSSGTAVMLEMARVIGQMKRQKSNIDFILISLTQLIQISKNRTTLISLIKSYNHPITVIEGNYQET